jgi:multiple sugar transport system substrate-binding protein
VRRARTSSASPEWCSPRDRPGPDSPSRTNKAERNLDVTPFPVTTNAADVTALMVPRLDAVYVGSSPVSSLTKLNKQMNDLFKVA